MEYLEHRATVVNDCSEEAVSAVEPSELVDQLDYVALAGGKCIHFAVTIPVCEAAGGTPEDAVDFAVGVELAHNASLVVDDVTDRSDICRGMPSAWAEYGYDPTIIVSDSLLGEASALPLSSGHTVRIVAESVVKLGKGEATELVVVLLNEAEYIQFAHRKTGALFRAATGLGTVAANGNVHVVRALGDYAIRVGVILQICDDMPDAAANTEELGKPTGQNAGMGRLPFVQVINPTPGEANRRARKQTDEALSALGDSGIGDSEPLEYLRDLTEFVIIYES